MFSTFVLQLKIRGVRLVALKKMVVKSMILFLF